MDLGFFELAVGFVFIWVGVNLWLMFARNFFYRTLGFNPSDTLDTFIVASIVTVVFWILIFVFPLFRQEEEDRNTE